MMSFPNQVSNFPPLLPQHFVHTPIIGLSHFRVVVTVWTLRSLGTKFMFSSSLCPYPLMSCFSYCREKKPLKEETECVRYNR